MMAVGQHRTTKSTGEGLLGHTGFAGLSGHGVDVYVLMVRNVPELFALPPQAHLVSLCHPLRAAVAKDVQEATLSELGGQLGLEGNERIDGVGVGTQGGQDSIVDDMLAMGFGKSRDGLVGGWRCEDGLAWFACVVHRARGALRKAEEQEGG